MILKGWLKKWLGAILKRRKRSFLTPQYKEWRKAVKDRDNKTCQWPGCKRCKMLEVHHIIRWADAPSLRYNVRNGITLCKKHHEQIRNREHIFAKSFLEIVLRNEKKNESGS